MNVADLVNIWGSLLDNPSARLWQHAPTTRVWVGFLVKFKPISSHCCIHGVGGGLYLPADDTVFSAKSKHRRRSSVLKHLATVTHTFNIASCQFENDISTWFVTVQKNVGEYFLTHQLRIYWFIESCVLYNYFINNLIKEPLPLSNFYLPGEYIQWWQQNVFEELLSSKFRSVLLSGLKYLSFDEICPNCTINFQIFCVVLKAGACLGGTPPVLYIWSPWGGFVRCWGCRVEGHGAVLHAISSGAFPRVPTF